MKLQMLEGGKWTILGVLVSLRLSEQHGWPLYAITWLLYAERIWLAWFLHRCWM